MNLDEIKRVLQLMEENRLVEFEYEDEERRIKLRRAEDRAAPVPLTAAVPVQGPATAPVPLAAPPGPDTAPVRADNLMEFRSPLVGTFYRAPRPDAEPFVNVGDEINPDKVICVIEAMKVMNEIKAETNGIIREILVKNSQAIEYGELLFLIEKK